MKVRCTGCHKTVDRKLDRGDTKCIDCVTARKRLYSKTHYKKQQVTAKPQTPLSEWPWQHLKR